VDLPKFSGHNFIVTVGMIKPEPLRRHIFDRAVAAGLRPWQGNGSV
jgi:hypothetical protein